ncbi:hypothetical protein [Corallococcus aberystwythensis]|uniref:Uncharacterized protein n=1 Tax=Corallococcus aberystwythensis TaxID=2316722 RepID=A0A3A8PRW7_9BACT|nr:hypothetical protein [Corallococcus aberystwythensis]RKH57581.1 hypothetical protein D7W81_30845 [Corallococcus aberystwythensis]
MPKKKDAKARAIAYQERQEGKQMARIPPVIENRDALDWLLSSDLAPHAEKIFHHCVNGDGQGGVISFVDYLAWLPEFRHHREGDRIVQLGLTEDWPVCPYRVLCATLPYVMHYADAAGECSRLARQAISAGNHTVFLPALHDHGFQVVFLVPQNILTFKPNCHTSKEVQWYLQKGNEALLEDVLWVFGSCNAISPQDWNLYFKDPDPGVMDKKVRALLENPYPYIKNPKKFDPKVVRAFKLRCEKYVAPANVVRANDDDDGSDIDIDSL